MLETNKYTNETIHVANWLLATGKARELIERARGIREGLEDYIDEEISEAFGQCFPDFAPSGIHDINSAQQPAEYYEDACAELLVLPLLSRGAFEVDPSDVADIILEQVVAQHGPSRETAEATA